MARHVKVDGELRGCPVDKWQLLDVISAYLAGRNRCELELTRVDE